ncbi:hypothetical protein [Dactylosporangium sp. NPDC048998]|uniref:hypothetical protein n=1 Tax=Dactylosporangium sp. NPDC048998 TaxID=3363976 RepID=UPI0037188BBB
MGRLPVITFRLPYSQASTAFLADLRTLLADVRNAFSAPGRLELTPLSPAGALPVTAFEIANIASPEVRLGDDWSLGIDAASWVAPPRSPIDRAARPDASLAPAIATSPQSGAGPLQAGDRPSQREVGEAADLEAGMEADVVPGVDMAELTRRLAGYVHAVDHTGVNIPAGVVPVTRWLDIVHSLAAISTMYRYPTGEPWPFVLPSTAAEFGDDIRVFVTGREPRFELVHDEWTAQPLWQFALYTDLSRAELEQRFPEPDGTAFPGLGEVFRAVTVRSPWPGLQVRFDLYYRHIGAPTDWETGEWLVTAGGRIRDDRGVRHSGAS